MRQAEGEIMRLLRLLPIAALLAAPATPMAAPPPRPDRAVPAVDPNRFCRRFVEGYREREERSYARSNMAYAPPMPPPPPPPAPPPPPPPPPATADLINSLPQSFASQGT